MHRAAVYRVNESTEQQMNQINKIINSVTNGWKSPSDWMVDWFRGGTEYSAGVRVNTKTALGFPPLWYAVNKISGHVARLPLNMRKKMDRGSEVASDHPTAKLLKNRPNMFQTAFTFKQQLMVHSLLYGNGRAAIVRRGGQPVELLPMLPERTVTCMVDGEKWHAFTIDEDDPLGTRKPPGFSVEGTYRVHDSDVLHILGLTYDGYTGVSLLDVAKEALGVGLAAQKAVASSFKNGTRPGLILQAPSGVLRDPKEAETFLAQFNKYHEGLDNQSRAALLREGMTVQSLQFSSSDAQWLEQRGFQRQDTALLFMLEQILGDDSSVSYSSLEQKSQAYKSNCLDPWLERWEQEANSKLLGIGSHSPYYFKFNANALLRPDATSRASYYEKMIMMRAMSPNEVRELEDMNPYEGGDEYANPAITPGTAGATRESDDEEPEDRDVSASDASRRAIVAHLRHMIGVEQKRVLAAAGNKDDYLGWVRSFYKSWKNKMRQDVKHIGGSSEIADTHCQESLDQITELAGSVTVEGLADAVAEATEHWQDRAEELAIQILTKKEPANVA